MALTDWKRALILGFLSWLAPFVFSVLAFRLKQVNAPLFETVMSLTVVAVAATLSGKYFRRRRPVAVREAVTLGFVWLAINLVLDYPLFAYGPMRMSAGCYYSQIGADYLLYPAFLAGAALLAARNPGTV